MKLMDYEIKRRLDIALDMLYEKEGYLLKNAAHERSITHKLAECLQVLFPDYHVDCEYDLNIDNVDGCFKGKKEIQILRNELLKVKRHVASGKGVVQEYGEILIPLNIYPDIVIHQRGTNERNVLIIEVKKSNNAS